VDNSSEGLVAAAVAFVTSLRTGEGFDDIKFDALKCALRAFHADWSTSEMLPKSAVLTLVDLGRMIEVCAPVYHGETRQRIVDASMEIVDVILEGF
jgi:hypothetical protein